MQQDPYQEKLDDPDLPFDFRWSLIDEIDQSNHRFRIYKKFIKGFEKWAFGQIDRKQPVSILEESMGFIYLI